MSPRPCVGPEPPTYLKRAECLAWGLPRGQRAILPSPLPSTCVGTRATQCPRPHFSETMGAWGTVRAEHRTQCDNTHPTQGFKAKQNKAEQHLSAVFLKASEGTDNVDGQRERILRCAWGALHPARCRSVSPGPSARKRFSVRLLSCPVASTSLQPPCVHAQPASLCPLTNHLATRGQCR